MRVTTPGGAPAPIDPARDDAASHAASSHEARAAAPAKPDAPPIPASAPSALHKLPAPGKPGPVLASAKVHTDATGVEDVTFDAAAPGDRYGAKGRESTAVSIYVDGRYQSTETILSERQDPKTGYGGYRVNLGVLPPGDHTVEIRSANDLAGPKSSPAIIRPGSVAGAAASGLEAQVERYAPLLVTRTPKEYGLANTIEGDLGLKTPLSPMTRTDIPLRMRAQIDGDPAGYHVIEYHATFSDEDSGTPDKQRLATYGRTTDDEWVYKVLLDGQGNKVSPQEFAKVKGSLGAAKIDAPEMVQYGTDSLLGGAKRHDPRAFDGMHAGDRPVVRVNSGNNNFAAVKAGDKITTPIWSPGIDLDTSKVKYDASGRPTSIGSTSALGVIADFPWVGQVAIEEMQREDNWTPPPGKV